MNESMMDRVPPHNNEAEQSVIGAVFLEPQALITASEVFPPSRAFERYCKATNLLS